MMTLRERLNKKKNDKGFTLVELIVVLVILAILAAILVPALLGYIDKAKEKQYVLNAKSVLTAAQACLSEAYGTDSAPESVDAAEIQKIADVPCTGFEISVKPSSDTAKTDVYSTDHACYTVYGVVYEEAGYTLVYDLSKKTWKTYKPGDTVTKPAGATTIATYPVTSSN